MPNTYPLVTRKPDDAITYLTSPIANLSLTAGKVDTETFLKHVEWVAKHLNDGKYAINLCDNRYLFLVSFCAVILRGHTNLLPPNKNLVTQQSLAEDYTGCYVIHDGGDTVPSLKHINVTQITMPESGYPTPDIPHIDDDHLACISFTSGSTGKSKPNLKYWRTLHRSTNINHRFMFPQTNNTVYQLATMPAQHMWGLETSALMALFANVCISDGKPLYPQDIRDTLHRLPEPRILVSTPVHLRALAAGPADNLTLYAVLCATSPLTSELATEIEQQFSAPLYEVYGCSEVGSMAVRRTAQEKMWQRFEGIHFMQQGETTSVSADHLPEATLLQDFINQVDDIHFTLAGRASDLIKIAGKRGSLFDINQTLLRFTGLEDGIVIYPESDRAVTRLCAIVALKPGVEKAALIRYLQQQLDSAFVPRPVYLVESLPRESNGKLLRSKLDTLQARLSKRRPE